MRKLMRLAAGVSAMLLVAPAAAQEAGSRKTRDFVQAAAQSDTFEILEAQAALVESVDPEVRAYARQMIQAHGATSDALTKAATRAGLKPPPKALSSDQSQLLGALQSQRGAAFDTLYVRHQALAHRAALTTEQQYATGGDQPDIRAVAASAVPIIAAHLDQAERLKAGKSE